MPESYYCPVAAAGAGCYEHRRKRDPIWQPTQSQCTRRATMCADPAEGETGALIVRTVSNPIVAHRCSPTVVPCGTWGMRVVVSTTMMGSFMHDTTPCCRSREEEEAKTQWSERCQPFSRGLSKVFHRYLDGGGVVANEAAHHQNHQGRRWSSHGPSLQLNSRSPHGQAPSYQRLTLRSSQGKPLSHDSEIGLAAVSPVNTPCGSSFSTPFRALPRVRQARPNAEGRLGPNLLEKGLLA